MAIERINPRIWFDRYHVSSDHNKVSLEIGHAEKDGTVFTNTAKNIIGTIPTVEAVGAAFVTLGTGNVHAALKSNINVANVPVTLGLDGGTDGTKAEFFLARV